MTEMSGWFAALVLLATIGRQVYTQWRDGSSKGLSRWLFVGQITASAAFIVYSWLLGNWVFVETNALMLVAATAPDHNRAIARPGTPGVIAFVTNTMPRFSETF
jgi:uncharacterized protein with PQ loop repeat